MNISSLMMMDQDALRRHVKLVTAPLSETVRKARTVVHNSVVVANAKFHWIKVMRELVEATHFDERAGVGVAAFLRWEKSKQAPGRLFPAALIFLAASAKKRLRESLDVQEATLVAINEMNDKMAYCTKEIIKLRACREDATHGSPR